jgi:hypothetical protein
MRDNPKLKFPKLVIENYNEVAAAAAESGELL